MKINKNVKKLAVLSTLFALASCGGGSSSSDATSASGAPSTLETLPAVTGPVVSSSKSALMSAFRKQANSGRVLQYATATTGLVLNEAGPTTFTLNTQSKAFCEMSNMIRSIYREAATPDKILCYLGAMKKNGVISDDVYSQNYVYFKLINLPDGDGGNSEPRIKTRIQLTNGKISDFKMFTCFNGSTVAPEQSEYISQEFTESGATIVAKNLGSGDWGDYGSSVTATGDINSSGEWLAKTLTAMNYWQSPDDSFSNNQGGTLTQGPASISVEGYQKGTWGVTSGEDSFSGEYQNGFVGFVETLGSESLGTLALGNGSSRFSINNTFTNGDDINNTWNFTGYESWNGDTLAKLDNPEDGEYYAEVEGVAIPTPPSTVEAVSFEAGEAWDCAADEGGFVDADFSSGGADLAADMMACEEKFGLGNDWINCSATYSDP